MGANDGAVDHRVFVVGGGGKMLEDLLPHTAVGPATEPPMSILPIAEPVWQIAPRDAGTVAIEHRFDESTIVLGGHADLADPPWQQVLDPLPLVVSPYRVIGQPLP